MEYTVIATGDWRELIAKVNEHINNGWRPQGGISTTVEYRTYAQALVRD
jgi:hypothetical protein